ncbi:hypothetical protein V8E53_004905 [Lactarius tabidus]
MPPFLPSIDIPSSLRPMKTVEQADVLMQHAHVLYEQYEHVMTPIDRTLAEDRMTFATDHRHGVEEKLWLARAGQASLYSNRAHEALDTVKVVSTVPPSRDAEIYNQITLRAPEWTEKEKLRPPAATVSRADRFLYTSLRTSFPRHFNAVQGFDLVKAPLYLYAGAFYLSLIGAGSMYYLGISVDYLRGSKRNYVSRTAVSTRINLLSDVWFYSAETTLGVRRGAADAFWRSPQLHDITRMSAPDCGCFDDNVYEARLDDKPKYAKLGEAQFYSDNARSVLSAAVISRIRWVPI